MTKYESALARLDDWFGSGADDAIEYRIVHVWHRSNGVYLFVVYTPYDKSLSFFRAWPNYHQPDKYRLSVDGEACVPT